MSARLRVFKNAGRAKNNRLAVPDAYSLSREESGGRADDRLPALRKSEWAA
jgi:hypothetical protein